MNKLNACRGSAGAFDLYVYETTTEPAEHLALVKGDLLKGGPVKPTSVATKPSFSQTTNGTQKSIERQSS